MILRIIDIFFQVYMIMLFARILGSWFPAFRNSRLMQFLAFYTDPYLNIFRRIIPPIGTVDISAIFVFICLSFIEQGVKILIVALLP